MTDRTALATLTLARDYLDSLLADSTPGPWGSWGGDSNLIVALHATAPAIRKLLKDEIMRMNDRIGQFTILLPTAEALLSTPHASQWITEREAK